MENEDKELEHRYTEFYNNYDLYMMKYILPEVYASQFASYYYRDLINGDDLRIYVYLCFCQHYETSFLIN